MTYETILTEDRNGILIMTMNRPERLNAWTRQMGGELRAAIENANADDDVNAMVLTGAGRGFCAGAEWTPFIEGSAPTEESPCAAGLGGTIKKTFRRFKGLFE